MKMRISIVLLVVAATIAASAFRTVSFAAEPEQSAKITFHEEEFGSLADALNISTKRWRVDFSVPVEAAWAEVEFYKDGKKLERRLKTAPLPVSTNGVADTFRRFEFVIHVIDLDQLKLGGAPEANHRWILKSGPTEGGGPVTLRMDIPKTEFGAPQIGTFTREGKVGRKFFACWAYGRTSDPLIQAADTAEDVIAKNPHTELAIVHVLWK